jgi:hypothetical protein
LAGLDGGKSSLYRFCPILTPFILQLLPAGYIAGLSLLPRQFDQERMSSMPGGNIYAALDRVDSPLLSEAGIYEESHGRFSTSRGRMDPAILKAVEAEN